MTDKTPNTLIKVEPTITHRYGTAQIIIFTLTGFSIVSILQFIINNRTNMQDVAGGAIAIILILLAVFLCARSELSLFQAERFIMFNLHKLTKWHEVYKYSKNTTIWKAKRFTGLEGIDDIGHIKFRNFSTYEHEKCNMGTCWTATPADSRDPDSFRMGMMRLFNAIPKGCIQKITVAQSKDLTNLAEAYEKKLQNPNLPPVVRASILAKKKYFENIKDRVGWMWVIFLGVGYYADDEEGQLRIDQVVDTYSKFLTLSGIKIKHIKNATDYALIYAQMYYMNDLQGLI